MCGGVRRAKTLSVIRRNHQTGAVSLDPLRWGLIPYWCEDPKGGHKLAANHLRNRLRVAASSPFGCDGRRERPDPQSNAKSSSMT